MTAEVKDELSRLAVNSVSARRAEVASLLRFAGGLHIVSGRIVVEAELIKLRTTRTFIALTASAVGISLLITILVASITEPTEEDVLTDVFTWLAFFGITAVAAYSVFGLILDIQAWVLKVKG